MQLGRKIIEGKVEEQGEEADHITGDMAEWNGEQRVPLTTLANNRRAWKAVSHD